jgi:hypothetical protein
MGDLKYETSRHGMFSYAPPLAIGDDSLTHVTQRRKDKDGAVPTEMPNITTSPGKSGKFGRAFFNEGTYLSAETSASKSPVRRESRSPIHDKAFTPAGKVKAKPIQYEY